MDICNAIKITYNDEKISVIDYAAELEAKEKNYPEDERYLWDQFAQEFAFDVNKRQLSLQNFLLLVLEEIREGYPGWVVSGIAPISESSFIIFKRIKK